MLPPLIKLTITLKDGQIFLEGPLQDRLFCYGLLEVAKDALRAQPAANQSPIEVAPASFIGPKH